jgi:tRNA pseudouridine32 synthase / 23S rRNA pseudouridine746 synthase
MMNDQAMTVIYEDAFIVVVEKASGFLSVPGRGEEKYDSVASRVKDTYEGCITQPAVHRLDMATSGILVLGLTKEAHRNLSIQFQRSFVEKKYCALIEGIVEAKGGVIELPFRLDVDNRPHQIYDPVHGKVGLTHWQNLSIEGSHTRVLFEPKTGRTHQLRLHASHSLGLGFPIVGDFLYGTGTDYNQLKLHAFFLSFCHPETGETLKFESIIPF